MKHTTRFFPSVYCCIATCIIAWQAAGIVHAQEIRTPAAPDTPRVNGPSVFGVRPGSPFLYKIPATGAGTIQYSVDGLPEGLDVDSSTGMITGSVATAGEYTVTLRATSTLGSNTKSFRIKVGDTIALTPSMGWNSWNCYGVTVTNEKVQANAQAMVSSGLIHHGWSYVNVDVGWEAPRGGPYNALQGNALFPDMQAYCDDIHALGLKAGLYSTPWTQTYWGYPGGSSYHEDGSFEYVPGLQAIGLYCFETNDAQQWAEWGVDYMKYDWKPIELPETVRMEEALQQCGRDIVYSLSNTTPFSEIETLSQHCNLWRNNDYCDITDSWESICDNGFGKDQWAPYQSPGHYNDPDILCVGRVGWGETQHSTNLTPDEQYTHITLWSLLGAPLLLGCDLTQLDDFTLNLLTNDEVIAVDQDPLCLQGVCVNEDGDAKVYLKQLEDGSIAVGLFNTGLTPLTVTADWADLGLLETQMVRDLWRQNDLGEFDGSFQFLVDPHSAELFRMSASAPEPGTFVLLTIGAAMLGRGRRR
ncbi:MAG: putative Ig domain-containing protein [Phycisphaerae bacterium]|nr:putative Ig domain-containing protein [Phycisphaerae bacterium]